MCHELKMEAYFPLLTECDIDNYSNECSVKQHFRTVVLILYYLLAKQNIYDLPKVLRSKPKEAQFVKQSMFKVMKRAETVKLRLVFFYQTS